ncbi:MAG: hypothetical protein WKG07_10035 [Hymenobacter sp.]
MPQLVPVLYAVGEKDKANAILDLLTTRSINTLSYYQTHDGALFDDSQRHYLLHPFAERVPGRRRRSTTRPAPRRPTRCSAPYLQEWQ